MPILKPTRGIQLNRTHPLAHGLVGCWLFNENTGGKVFDLSGNGNTGSLVASTQFVPGKFGSCLDFDGNGDYVSLGIGVTVTSTSHTILGWFKSPDLSVTRVIHSQTNSNTASSKMISLELSETGNVVYYRRLSVSPWSFSITSPNSYDDDNWHFVVATTSLGTNNNFTLYVDGIQVASTTNVYSLMSYVDNRRIGNARMQSGDAYYFNGLIDEVMIFNRALTNIEVNQLYREPFCMFERRINPALFYVTAGGIIVEPSAIEITGSLQAPSLNYDYLHLVSLIEGDFAIQNPSILISYTHSPSVLELSLGLQSPLLAYDMRVSPSLQTLTITIQSPNINYDYAVTAAAIAISIALNEPSINLEASFAATAQGLSLAIQSPNINYDMTVLAIAIEIALSQKSVNVNYDYLFAVAAAIELSAALQNPSISTSVNISTTAQGISIAVNGPSLSYDFTKIVTTLEVLAVLQSVNLDYDYAFDVSVLPALFDILTPVVLTTIISSWKEVTKPSGNWEEPSKPSGTWTEVSKQQANWTEV